MNRKINISSEVHHNIFMKLMNSQKSFYFHSINTFAEDYTGSLKQF